MASKGKVSVTLRRSPAGQLQSPGRPYYFHLSHLVKPVPFPWLGLASQPPLRIQTLPGLTAAHSVRKHSSSSQVLKRFACPKDVEPLGPSSLYGNCVGIASDIGVMVSCGVSQVVLVVKNPLAKKM